MSDDEQMAEIGRMVTRRKQLQRTEALLVEQTQRASKEFQGLSGYMANYKIDNYVDGFEITPAMQEVLNPNYLTSLIAELIQVRRELHELGNRLRAI